MSRKSIYSLLFLALTPLLAFAQSPDVPEGSTPPAPGVPALPVVPTPPGTSTNPLPFRVPPRKAATVRPAAMPDAGGVPRPTLPVMPGAPGMPSANPAPTAVPLPGLPTPNNRGVNLPAGQAVDAAIDPGEATFDFNLVGAPITQVLDRYADLVNRTQMKADFGTMVIPSDPAKNTITFKTKCPLTRKEAIMALETVLGMNGITMVNMGDKFFKVVTDTTASMQGGPLSTNDSGHIPEMGRFVTQVIQWKYASDKDINDVLKPFVRTPNSVMTIPSTQTLVLRDYAENVKRMVEMVEKIDIPTPLEIRPRVIPIKYALAADIQQVLGSLGGGGSTVGSQRTSAGTTVGAAASMRSGTGTYGSGVSTVGSNPGTTNPSGAAGVGGGGARSTFQNNLARAIGRAGGLGGSGGFSILGQTQIIADERTNSLLVFANDDDMKMIQMIVDKLDVVLAQVLIESIIMEVTLSNNRDLGVSYLQHPQNFGSSSYTVGGINNLGNTANSSALYGAASSGATNGALGGLPGGFSYLTSINRDLDVIVQAVAGDSRVNVLSRPRIQTSHAVPATLFVGDTVPYVTGNSYGGVYGNNAQYQPLKVGITLNVTPLINPDGLVVMDIDQDIEQIGGYVTIQGVGDVPKTTERSANAKVAVRDRDTIMLGGFISNSKSTTRSGVPWLMDIPFLGALFRSDSDKHDKVELIVLIRPTVLPTPSAAAVFAGEERDKLSGVKRAEMEMREEERKAAEKNEAAIRKSAAKRAKKAKDAAKDSVSDGSSVEPVPNWDADRTATQQGAPVPNNEK